MELYNVLSEVDYYPRPKCSPELNPVYTTYNDWMAAVEDAVALAPSHLTSVTWIAMVELWLSGPFADEREMFAAAGVEVERLKREARV